MEKLDANLGFIWAPLAQCEASWRFKACFQRPKDAVRENLCMRRPQTLAHAGEARTSRVQVQRLESHRAMGIFEAIE